MANQPKLVLTGKKLYNEQDVFQGTITRQITDLGMCDQHTSCPGPVVRFKWADGRDRKECLYVLIKVQGWKLKET